MAFTKQAAFTKKVTDLPDKPSPTYTATDIKAHFQTPADELKTTLNKLVDDLHATASGASGAKNIGTTTITGLTGNDIQTLLEGLKTLADSKTTNTGDHKGTWQGYTPTQTDPGIQDVVDSHTAQLAENTQKTTLYFIQNPDKLRTREIIAVQGFYSVDDNFHTKYRVKALAGNEVWETVTFVGNSISYSADGEILAGSLNAGVPVAGSKKLKCMPKHSEVDVKAFGAKNDGTYADANNIAIKYALKFIADKYTLKMSDGVYTTTLPIVFDLTKSYKVEGVGYGDGNRNKRTVIQNNGTGTAISLFSNTNPTNIGRIEISHMEIHGSASGSHGLDMKHNHSTYLHDLYIANHGAHGINMVDCWGSKVERVTSVYNKFTGINLYNRCNNVIIKDSQFIDNCQVAGYANVIIGAQDASYHHEGLIMTGCDISGAGTTPTPDVANSWGMIIAHVKSFTFEGNYMELGATGLIYGGTNIRALSMRNNIFMDGNVTLEADIEDSVIESNTFYKNDVNYTTTLTVNPSNMRNNVKVGNNHYYNGATKNLLNGVHEPIIQYGSAIPTTGTWSVGDKIYNTSPTAGGYEGWLCVTAGTPGIWKGFGAIAV